jgi:hypothetical protein
MYTLWLYGLFLFAFMSGYKNPVFLQFVKANAVILSVTVLGAYALFRMTGLEDIRQKYFPRLSLYWFIVGDMVLHQLPLLYFGFPVSFIALGSAYGCLIGYYLMYRDKVPTLYSSAVSVHQYDVLFMLVGGMVLFYGIGLIIYRTIV